MSNEKEIFQNNLVRSYRASTPEERAVCIAVWTNIFEEYRYIFTGVTEDIWKIFTQFPVSGNKKPFGFTIPGLMLPTAKNFLMQGEHWTVQYKWHNISRAILRYNPVYHRSIISKNGDEQYKFMTPEMEKQARKVDGKAFMESYKNLRYLIVHLLFTDKENFKKLTSSKGDGKDGINQQILALFEEKDESGNFQHYMQDLSEEKRTRKYKDGVIQPLGTTDSGAKYYEVKENHPHIDALDGMRKILAANVWEYEKSKKTPFTDLSDDDGEYMGMLSTIADILLDMTTSVTSKYNVGVCNDTTNKGKVIEEMVKLNKPGLYITNSPNYNDKKDASDKYLDDNPIQAHISELYLYIHPKDYAKFKDVVMHLPNTSVSTISEYLGIPDSNIIQFNAVAEGEPRIWHKRTMGIHPVITPDGNFFTPGSAEYDQISITNLWIDYVHHEGIWPYIAIILKKKGSS